ncbi:hypothetical protein JOD43_003890 [Pullulanibacillus pueri]|uniref:Uncharacterized protein n=1 Tax=Pullulanibacillus pueri TaxID=1437324 RepID=A0A8J3EMM9_9BACL|nr:hypothetical protein [Pullulanibacillus pueri]MBM7683710.1 hypothetical protein [Pullulanibacillus pueri]GGH85201.1 hypothetical protein GCM10007096_30040 [Pullulanibacillus pueri]
MDHKKSQGQDRKKENEKNALDKTLGRPQNPPPQPKDYEEIEY